jgi:hypothetical protein
VKGSHSLIQETNGILFPAPGMNEQNGASARSVKETNAHQKVKPCGATFVIKRYSATISSVRIRVARRRNNEPRVVMEDNLGVL